MALMWHLNFFSNFFFSIFFFLIFSFECEYKTIVLSCNGGLARGPGGPWPHRQANFKGAKVGRGAEISKTFTRLVTFDLSYLLLVNVYTFLVNLSSVLHQMLVPKIAEMANKGDPEVNFFLCRPTMVGGV